MIPNDLYPNYGLTTIYEPIRSIPKEDKPEDVKEQKSLENYEYDGSHVPYGWEDTKDWSWR